MAFTFGTYDTEASQKVQGRNDASSLARASKSTRAPNAGHAGRLGSAFLAFGLASSGQVVAIPSPSAPESVRGPVMMSRS